MLDARRIMAEIDRLARIPFWPGFDPRRAPLLREPGEWRSVTDWAALAIHEAFHVFQSERHPDWAANETDLFIYPVEDAVSLCLSRLEVMALQRALRRAGVTSGAWVRTALALRRERFGRLPSWAVAYERGTELTEGLAAYVERRAQGRSFATILPGAGFSADEVRRRCACTGSALAALLDRATLSWKERLESGPAIALDELLVRSLGDGEAASFTGQERGTAMARAIADARDLIGNRRAMRDAYLDQTGWRIEIDAAAAPLMAHRFDPMNVQHLGAGEVLHTRWLDLRNTDGSIEVMDRPALTVAAGTHPILDGVRRVVVAGLTMAPEVRPATGVTMVEAPGCRGEFREPAVEQRGTTTRIRIRIRIGS